MIDIKNIILNEDIRNDILKYNWSRKESIKYNKLKYITKPYTQKDLDMALQYDSYDLVVEFLDKLIFTSKIDVMIINECQSLRTFQYVYNYLKNIYDIEKINILKTEIYIRKGLTEIINFIYDEGFTINVDDINDADMCELLINKCKINYKMIPISHLGYKVLIYLYENELIEYELEDAILDGNIDMIDYFLDDLEKIPTTQQVCQLISIGYERLDVMRDFDTKSDEIAMNLIEIGDMDAIEGILIAGFDRDILINYCIERGYEDMESILYNY